MYDLFEKKKYFKIQTIGTREVLRIVKKKKKLFNRTSLHP